MGPSAAVARALGALQRLPGRLARVGLLAAFLATHGAFAREREREKEKEWTGRRFPERFRDRVSLN